MGSRQEIAQVLSPRQRSALRLDLEDRQAELIAGLYSVSQDLLTPLRGPHTVPETWRSRLRALDPSAADGLAAGLGEIDTGLERLSRVNLALARLDGPDFGLCTRCHEPIDFEALAADPTLLKCRACASR